MQNAPLKFGGILKMNPIISDFKFPYLTCYTVLIISPSIHFLLLCLLSDTMYGHALLSPIKWLHMDFEYFM